MVTTVIVYDLTPYAEANNEFLLELQSAIPKGRLEISKIFELLPLNIIRPFNGQQRLERRGNGAFVIQDGAFVNSADQADQITFLDDQLDEIVVDFPLLISVGFTTGSSVTVTSIGHPINVRFKVLPPDVPLVSPIRFDNFVIGHNRMKTTFIDAAGNIIAVDGTVDPAASAVQLSTIVAALRDGAEDPCPKTPAPPPQENWKFAIYRQGTSGMCRVITPGMEWGSRRLGIYNTKAEAEKAMQKFLNDGEPPNNTNPTCEGRG
jgi:hypothetical protein